MLVLKRLLILIVVAMAISCPQVRAASYSALSSPENQLAAAENTPYPIVMVGDLGASYKLDKSKVTVLRDGDYFVSAAVQIGGKGTGEVYVWMRLNGKDIPDSNSIQTVPSAGFTAVLVSQTGITLKKGDYIEFVYAATAPGLGMIATKPAGMPAVPSVLFTIFEF